LRKLLILSGFLAFLALGFSAVAGDEVEKLLGDESDGSRAYPIHRIPVLAEPNEQSNPPRRVDPNVDPDSDVLLPFSTRRTCGSCHSYGTIGKGWHFNAAEPNVAHGRPGQPWIYFDAGTGTQIPLSYRAWPGTFTPKQFGLTDRAFTRIFGRHTPGGGAGERECEEPAEAIRQFISGKLEINCLSCHNGDARQDQGGVGGYAMQIARGNWRWAAAVSSGMASVKGSADNMDDAYDPFDPFAIEMAREERKIPPTITYHDGVFDHENNVFFDILREVPSNRCYFCHSNVYMDGKDTEKWSSDEDIHLTAGLKCVDCHRNGIDHNIIRGYDGEEATSSNELAATSSCAGCHLPQESGSDPAAGRLGAPVPEHLGLPPVHFEKLACTACHSGPWPSGETHVTKTSRAHRLGTPNVTKTPEMLPHIASPVFAKQGDGKIAPHKLVWPSFWGVLTEANIEPVPLDTVTKVVGRALAGEKPPPSGGWPEFTTEHIVKGLTSLASESTIEGKPVYVSAGKVYSLDESGKLLEEQGHAQAQPYMWPLAHDVRPAAQSLGVRYCTDCHATDAPFFFGSVGVDSPIASERDSAREMVEFEGIDGTYAWAFAFSFVFRPWLKVVALGSCAILAVVLLLYALKALGAVVKVLGEEN
jgi:hypothetical protein